MHSLFKMRWGADPKELDAQHRELYQRLTDPDSEEYILGDPAYYGFFTYTLFTGRKTV